jgi:hypothetical protein
MQAALIVALWSMSALAVGTDELASAGIWTALKSGDSFADVGAAGAGRLALVRPDGSSHFVLRLSHPAWHIPPAAVVSLHMIFTGGDAFRFPALGSGSVIQADIPDDQVASWTHNFTAMKMVTISFEGLSESPWVMPLTGTTPTVTAMAKAMEAGGVTGMPWPWSPSTNAQAAIPDALKLPVAPADAQPPPDTPSAPFVGAVVVPQAASRLPPTFAPTLVPEPLASPPSPATEGAPAPRSDHPLMPAAELSLAASVERYAAAYDAAQNDMAKGALRPQRARSICAAVPFQVSGWIGKISVLSSNNDGKGVLGIRLSSRLSVETNNNDLSDSLSDLPTLIPVGSAVHESAMALSGGQAVVFSGRFVADPSDCFKELSLTVEGAMSDPEFLFQFSDIRAVP